MILSIIIPCFNCFDKMKRCLFSLEQQTIANFEVVIIDDCSTDNTYLQLLDYQSRTSLDLKILRNASNKGPGETRNKGLSVAVGDYIFFVDSDDFLDNSTCEKIKDCINSNPCDLLVFDYFTLYLNKKMYGSSIPTSGNGYIEFKHALVKMKGATWCKVYKKTIIEENGLIFLSLFIKEDMPFSKCALNYCNKIFYYKEPLYNYVINKESLMYSNRAYDFENDIMAFQYLENFYAGYPEELTALFNSELLYPCTMNLIISGVQLNQVKQIIQSWIDKYPLFYADKWTNSLPYHQRYIIHCIYRKKWLHAKIGVHLIRLLKLLRTL